jgi:hypothetical protein
VQPLPLPHLQRLPCAPRGDTGCRELGGVSQAHPHNRKRSSWWQPGGRSTNDHFKHRAVLLLAADGKTQETLPARPATPLTARYRHQPRPHPPTNKKKKKHSLKPQRQAGSDWEGPDLLSHEEAVKELLLFLP